MENIQKMWDAWYSDDLQNICGARLSDKEIEFVTMLLVPMCNVGTDLGKARTA